MKAVAKVIGFGALCLVGAVSGDVRAEQQLVCTMRGMWVEQQDKFFFNVNYLAKDDGPDSFSGIYVNKSAGATANVTGHTLKGTWDIRFTYSDAQRQGVVIQLVGTGTRDHRTNEIVISGTFNATQHPEKLRQASRAGKFTMNGNCK